MEDGSEAVRDGSERPYSIEAQERGVGVASAATPLIARPLVRAPQESKASCSNQIPAGIRGGGVAVPSIASCLGRSGAFKFARVVWRELKSSVVVIFYEKAMRAFGLMYVRTRNNIYTMHSYIVLNHTYLIRELLTTV